MEKIYTVKEVAEILKVNQATVYRLAEGGKLPHSRVGLRGGCIRISEKQLEDYWKTATS